MPQEIYKVVEVVEGKRQSLIMRPQYRYTYPLYERFCMPHMFVFQTYDQAQQLIDYDAYPEYPLEIWRCLAWEVVQLKRRIGQCYLLECGEAYWSNGWHLYEGPEPHARKYLSDGRTHCDLAWPYDGESVCEAIQLVERMPLLQPLRQHYQTTDYTFTVDKGFTPIHPLRYWEEQPLPSKQTV